MYTSFGLLIFLFTTFIHPSSFYFYQFFILSFFIIFHFIFIFICWPSSAHLLKTFIHHFLVDIICTQRVQITIFFHINSLITSSIVQFHADNNVIDKVRCYVIMFGRKHTEAGVNFGISLSASSSVVAVVVLRRTLNQGKEELVLSERGYWPAV